MTTFILGLGVIAANFLYAYMNVSVDYSMAFERSYFQAMAMVTIVWLPAWIEKD